MSEEKIKLQKGRPEFNEEKQEVERQIECNETRRFRYGNDESEVNFEFEIDVSNPEIALVEIADFKELLTVALEDLEKLGKVVASKIEKPKEEEKTHPKPQETASKN